MKISIKVHRKNRRKTTTANVDPFDVPQDKKQDDFDIDLDQLNEF